MIIPVSDSARARESYGAMLKAVISSVGLFGDSFRFGRSREGRGDFAGSFAVEAKARFSVTHSRGASVGACAPDGGGQAPLQSDD